jgi:hypothetical protein
MIHIIVDVMYGDLKMVDFYGGKYVHMHLGQQDGNMLHVFTMAKCM